MTTTLISGSDLMNSINEGNTYNRGIIMKLASRVYRFEKRFNKSLKWGEAIKHVWQLVINLMKSYRKPQSEMKYISVDAKTNLIY